MQKQQLSLITHSPSSAYGVEQGLGLPGYETLVLGDELSVSEALRSHEASLVLWDRWVKKVQRLLCDSQTIGNVRDFSQYCCSFLKGLRKTARTLVRRTSLRYLYGHWAPLRLPGSVQSVLFICKGNICRSPLAKAYFQSLVKQNGAGISVRSAGLETTPGKPADIEANAVALQHQFSLDMHLTTPVHTELIDQSDLIIVMEISQKIHVERLYPRSKGKVVLLGRFDPHGSLEIADPYSGSREDFHFCIQQVIRCCDRLAASLAHKPAMSPVLSLNPAGWREVAS